MTLPEVQRLAKLEEKVDGIAGDIAEVKDILKGLDGRYASKLSEKIVYGLVGLIVSSVVFAFLAQVIR